MQVQNHEVILTGTVENREEKRRAEDLVESISGVHNVENRTRVARGTDYSSRDYSGTNDQSNTINEALRNTGTDR